MLGAVAILGVCFALKWAVVLIMSVAVPLVAIGVIALALYFVLRR